MLTARCGELLAPLTLGCKRMVPLSLSFCGYYVPAQNSVSSTSLISCVWSHAEREKEPGEVCSKASECASKTCKTHCCEGKVDRTACSVCNDVGQCAGTIASVGDTPTALVECGLGETMPDKATICISCVIKVPEKDGVKHPTYGSYLLTGQTGSCAELQDKEQLKRCDQGKELSYDTDQEHYSKLHNPHACVKCKAGWTQYKDSPGCVKCDPEAGEDFTVKGHYGTCNELRKYEIELEAAKQDAKGDPTCDAGCMGGVIGGVLAAIGFVVGIGLKVYWRKQDEKAKVTVKSGG